MKTIAIALVAAALGAAVAIGATRKPGGAVYQPPRTADGTPDLNGIWQAVNTANWDLQGHAASQGKVVALGAAFSVPGGLGVVEGGEIPYQSWALAKKKENAEQWLTRDPEIKCYMPGVPRATYMPYPFQIVQTPAHMLFAYEFASASRIVYMNSKDESPAESWMGFSRGSWDGDTLVIDVTGFNEDTWFDRAGNFHSADLHVVERYRRTGPDVLQYEATITDPRYSRAPGRCRCPSTGASRRTRSCLNTSVWSLWRS